MNPDRPRVTSVSKMKPLLCLLNVLVLLLFPPLFTPLWANEPPGEAEYAVFMGDNGVIVLKLVINVGGSTPRGSFSRIRSTASMRLASASAGAITPFELLVVEA